MPELRIDPICGRRVLLAAERAARPSDFATAQPADSPAAAAARRAACPFCAGREAATPAAVLEVPDAAGRWQVRVVPNKFPALSLDGVDGARGVHEVIVEAPEHWTGLDELPVDRLAAALGAGRDRLRHWSGVGGLRQGVVFKNSGAAAGASLEHVHSQLMALADVPETIAAELAGAEAWRRSQGSCAFCDLAAREIAAGDRLVLRRDGFVVLCAYAGRQPWEMWVLPERHAARYDQAADAELRPLAQVLQEAVGRLTAAAGPTAYNLILHTAPWDERHRDSYHWHWEIVPRTTHLAGFEWGAGMFINPLPPEHAAEQLRRARA